MILKEVFGDNRIIGFAGNKNSGKSNNLISLIIDYRKHNNLTEIYIYGFKHEVVKFLRGYNVTEVSTLKQITLKKDCILIIDEMQKLKFSDRRYKDDLDDFIDFVYHSNVRVILASPNLREFNSIIGSKIEGWILKSLNQEDLINGCHLKRVVDEYKGNMKVFKSLDIPKGKILIINNEKEKVVSLEYIKEADTKADNKNLFQAEIVKEIVKKNGQEKRSQECQEIVKKLSDREKYSYSDVCRWYDNYMGKMSNYNVKGGINMEEQEKTVVETTEAVEETTEETTEDTE